jgi:hypothetical protein
MALTLQQLQANLDSINQQIAGVVSKARSPDGKEVTYRPMAELLLAKGNIEEQIRTYGGKSDSKSTLAEHSRGYGHRGAYPRGHRS